VCHSGGVLHLGLAKRVTRHDPFTTRLTSDPFSLNPDTTRSTKRVGAPDTARPVNLFKLNGFDGSPDTTREPVYLKRVHGSCLTGQHDLLDPFSLKCNFFF
jgi:hypothetical protein